MEIARADIDMGFFRFKKKHPPASSGGTLPAVAVEALRGLIDIHVAMGLAVHQDDGIGCQVKKLVVTLSLSRTSSSACLRPVISREMPMMPMIFPVPSSHGIFVLDTHLTCPVFCFFPLFLADYRTARADDFPFVLNLGRAYASG